MGSKLRDAALKRALERGGVVAGQMLAQDAVLPFGLFQLDYVLLGTGGIPLGRLVEMYGPWQGGKSLLSYRLIASAQRLFPDRLATVYETEASLMDAPGVKWMSRQGVDVDSLPVRPGVTALDEMFKLMEADIKSGDFSLIVLDSLAMGYLQGMSEVLHRSRQPRGYGQLRPVAADARMVVEFLKLNLVPAHEARCTLVVCNQIRASGIGEMGGGIDDSQEESPGGRALRHASSVRLHCRRVGDLVLKKDGELIQRYGHGEGKVCGALSDVEVVKSKIGPRGRRTREDTLNPLVLSYETGQVVDDLEEYVVAGVRFGCVEQGGSHYTWGKVKAQGRANFLGAVAAAGKIEDFKRDVEASVLATPDAESVGGAA